MSEKNPFVALGFSPVLFEGLTDQEIKNLARAQYRALSLIYHPDAKGDAEKFKEISEAVSKIEDNFQFNFWKKLFLRSRKDRLDELEKKCDSLKEESQKYQENLSSLWGAFCCGRKTFEYNYPEILKGIRSFSVFDPPDLDLIIKDEMESLLKKQAVKAQKPEKREYKNQDFPTEIFELRIRKGLLTKQKLVKTNFNPEQDSMPSIRRQLIELRTTPPSRSYYWKPEGNAVVLKGTKLLGSIKKEDAMTGPLYKQLVVKGFISSDISSSDFSVLREGYSFSEFISQFRWLTPYIELSCLMVVVTEELRFKILGNVHKILLPIEE